MLLTWEVVSRGKENMIASGRKTASHFVENRATYIFFYDFV